MFFVKINPRTQFCPRQTAVFDRSAAPAVGKSPLHGVAKPCNDKGTTCLVYAAKQNDIPKVGFLVDFSIQEGGNWGFCTPVYLLHCRYVSV